MKDISVEELKAISPEIHEAAMQVGCTEVGITGRIWPGGRLSGPLEEAARFIEFSWHRAAVINGRAIFEDSDPKGYSALLGSYGLEEDPYPEPAGEPEKQQEQEPATHTAVAAAPSEKVQLTVQLLPSTRQELERQARAAGVSIGEFLDWKFRAQDDR